MALGRPRDIPEVPSCPLRSKSQEHLRLSPDSQTSDSEHSMPHHLQSSTDGSEVEQPSSMSSAPSEGEEDTTMTDSSSDVSSEDSDASSGLDTEQQEEEQEADRVTLRGSQKPDFSTLPSRTNAAALQERLKAFLPKLEEANKALEGGANSNMEEVGEGEAHIEMSLGLGVLEEKREGGEDSENEENNDEDGEEVNVPPSEAKREKDIMGKLLGREKNAKATSIEEVA